MKEKYFPILLCRAGELDALKNLDSSVIDSISPIIQIENDSKIDKLINSWDLSSRELIIDVSLFTFSINELEKILNLLLIKGKIIPLISSNSHLEYRDLIDHLIRKGDIHEICYQVETNTGISQLNNLIQRNGLFGLSCNKINVLINQGYINEINHIEIEKNTLELIDNLHSADLYNNIIISSGSLPSDLSKFSPKTLFHILPRYEWRLWKIIKTKFNELINLNYSDYGIKSAIISNNSFTPSCSIKYSNIDNYIILRGEQSKSHINGHGQYISHCKQLVISNYYSGETYSWGDKTIMDKSNQSLISPKSKPGNATTWVSIGQNHHITLISKSL